MIPGLMRCRRILQDTRRLVRHQIHIAVLIAQHLLPFLNLLRRYGYNLGLIVLQQLLFIKDVLVDVAWVVKFARRVFVGLLARKRELSIGHRRFSFLLYIEK